MSKLKTACITFIILLLTILCIGGITNASLWAYHHTANVTGKTFNSSVHFRGHHGYTIKDYDIIYNEDGTITAVATFWDIKKFDF